VFSQLYYAPRNRRAHVPHEDTIQSRATAGRSMISRHLESVLTCRWIGRESNSPQPDCKSSSPPWNMPTQYGSGPTALADGLPLRRSAGPSTKSWNRPVSHRISTGPGAGHPSMETRLDRVRFRPHSSRSHKRSLQARDSNSHHRRKQLRALPLDQLGMEGPVGNDPTLDC
jgi:hypothetical protein